MDLGLTSYLRVTKLDKNTQWVWWQFSGCDRG